MSRLDSYRQKQFTKRVVLVGVALILLAIFMATIGFNLLVRSSVYLGELGKSSQADTDTEAFFGTLDVDTPPIATNSAKIVMSGSISGFDTIEISINDKKVKTIEDESNFSETVGNLTKGQNEVKVLARSSKNKKEIKRETFSVLYIDEKPKLEITEPTDGSRTNNPDLKIVGKTDSDVTIRVNDAPTVTDVQGTFQTFIRLKDGENKIKVVATDLAGNTETKEITVRYLRDD